MKLVLKSELYFVSMTCLLFSQFKRNYDHGSFEGSKVICFMIIMIFGKDQLLSKNKRKNMFHL